MVVPPNNDEVLEPARYEQLPVVHKPQITGAQKGPLARVRQVRPKRALRPLILAPIPSGDASSRYPDLSYAVRRAAAQGGRVDYGNLLAPQGLPAAHQHPGASLPGRGRDYPVA